jgi:ABC-type antimicrobial peptide transport system permease subunit
MLKSIFIQILNRKRSNGWIVLELILVFSLVWYISDYFFVLNYNYSIPDGRNLKHTWQVALAEYPDIHPRYSAEANTDEALETNFARILQTIRNYPGVEVVSVSDRYSTPVGGSYIGNSFFSVDDSTNSVSGQEISIDPKEDFFRVFGYTTDNGKTPVKTGDFDWSNPKGVVIGHSVADRLFPDGQAIGKMITRDYIILGVVDNIKRFDYERPQHVYYLPFRPAPNDLKDVTISIRTSSSLADASFQEAFKKEMKSRLQVGNFYLKEVVSYSRSAADRKNNNYDMRVRTYLMLFFLLNILLCVMGTFWYRIQTRREEIGVRKAMGSTGRSIRNLLLAEGLCLLLIATLPAMFLEFQFVHAGLIDTLGQNDDNKGMYLPDRTMLRFLITNGITWTVMAAVVITAIWLPARKAAAMSAADALHYE